MKLTINNLKKLLADANPMVKWIIKDLLNNASNATDLKTYMSDVVQYGCQSGTVSSLVWFSDTTKFYEKFKSEIGELLYDALQSIGSNDPVKLFGNAWDKEDPLALEQHNQNLLAWFAYEETTRAFLTRFDDTNDVL